jgi:hypothetical protein
MSLNCRRPGVAVSRVEGGHAAIDAHDDNRVEVLLMPPTNPFCGLCRRRAAPAEQPSRRRIYNYNCRHIAASP